MKTLFNDTGTDQYYFIDEWNMCLVNNGGDLGRGDCIGRTFFVYFITEDIKYLQAIIQNWAWNKNGVVGCRHPEHDDLADMSRDHLMYTVLTLKLGVKWGHVSQEYFQGFLNCIKWRLTKTTTMRGLWTFVKLAITGNAFQRWLYYIIQIPIIWGSLKWNTILQNKADMGYPGHHEDYIPTQPEDLTKRQNKLRDLLYPAYALHGLIWELAFLPNSWWKHRMSNVILNYKYFDWYNLHMRLILGDCVSREEIRNYKPMTGWRPSTELGWTGRRGCRYLKEDESEENALDVLVLYELAQLSEK